MGNLHKTIAYSMTEDMRNIFIKRMKALGITQAGLAKKMGKSRACINMFMKQKSSITLPVIVEFCIALNLELQILIKEGGPHGVVDKTVQL